MYVFSVQYVSLVETIDPHRQDPDIPRGAIGTSLYQREWGRWGLKYLRSIIRI